ncbi:MAG: glycosyltransferase [Ruminococcus bromii]|nr:glycosyltransferase [Ruminococcus bromii]
MSTITRASVVIATYNGEKYIEQQLLSIINQSVKPYEIIISDDNSKDNTLSICQRIINENYTDDIKIRLLKNDVNNKGIANNFENGFKHVTGQVVFLCDQDDIWMPNKIETMLELMNKTNKKFAFHNVKILSETSTKKFKLTNQTLFNINNLKALDSTSVILNTEYYYRIALLHCYILGMCMCIETNLLKKMLPLTKARNHDDWILCCAMFEGSVVSTNECLAYYRRHENNNSILSEYKMKLSLAEKLKKFDKEGCNSIKQLYCFSTDIWNYTNHAKITDDNIDKIYEFYRDERICALRKHKFFALLSLMILKKNGDYNIDGNIMFYHDIWFCLSKSFKNRNQFIDECKNYIREI